MSPYARRWTARLARTSITASAAIALTACAPSIRLSPDYPLILANCPKLAPLTDETFAATASKLIEVSAQYRKCRAAALMTTPTQEKTDGTWRTQRTETRKAD